MTFRPTTLYAGTPEQHSVGSMEALLSIALLQPVCLPRIFDGIADNALKCSVPYDLFR